MVPRAVNRAGLPRAARKPKTRVARHPLSAGRLGAACTYARVSAARKLSCALHYNRAFPRALREIQAMKFLLTLLSLLIVTGAAAQQSPLPVPPPPTVAAKSWVLYDFLAAQVIASQNPNERIEPASLTKMMTAYLTYE